MTLTLKLENKDDVMAVRQGSPSARKTGDTTFIIPDAEAGALILHLVRMGAAFTLSFR